MIRFAEAVSLLILLSSCSESLDSSNTSELLAHCKTSATVVRSSRVEDLRSKAEAGARSCALVLARELSDADRAKANLYHGILLKYQGRGDQAIDSLRAAVTLDPDNALAHYEIGVAFLDEARRMEAEATSKQPTTAYSEAVTHLRKAVDSEGVGVDRYGYLAIALWSAGLHDGAVEAYKKDVGLNPNDRRRRISLAWKLNYLNHHAEALAVFNEADLVTPATAPELDSDMTREIRAASSRGERWKGWDDTTVFER